jgi:hypothetical protein
MKLTENYQNEENRQLQIVNKSLCYYISVSHFSMTYLK